MRWPQRGLRHIFRVSWENSVNAISIMKRPGRAVAGRAGQGWQFRSGLIRRSDQQSPRARGRLWPPFLCHPSDTGQTCSISVILISGASLPALPLLIYPRLSLARCGAFLFICASAPAARRCSPQCPIPPPRISVAPRSRAWRVVSTTSPSQEMRVCILRCRSRPPSAGIVRQKIDIRLRLA
jgi:hypothetical protein